MAAMFPNTVARLSLKRKLHTGPTMRPFSMRKLPSRVSPVRRSVRGSTKFRYQSRVTDMPRFTSRYHLLDRRRPARHHEASRLRDRILSHFFCPEARITQGFHNAALDPDRPTLRKTILAEYRFRRDRIIRIGIDGDGLVEEPFAELVAAALLAEKTPSLIGGTGFHHPEHLKQEIGDRCRFQDDRVFAGIELDRCLCLRCLVNGTPAKFELCRGDELGLGLSRPTRPGPGLVAGRDRELRPGVTVDRQKGQRW